MSFLPFVACFGACSFFFSCRITLSAGQESKPALRLGGLAKGGGAIQQRALLNLAKC